jgi:hypothetical protein
LGFLIFTLSVGASSPIALGNLDLCFLRQQIFPSFREKTLRKFGEMCFSIVILTNFAIFGAKFSQISRPKYEKKTLLWISVVFSQFWRWLQAR